MWVLLIICILVAFLAGYLVGFCIALDERNKGKGERYD